MGALRETKYVLKPLDQIKLSEHFTLREFCFQDLMVHYGIKNMPKPIGIERGKLLVSKVIEPIYKEFGFLRILCGHNSDELNSKRMKMRLVAGNNSRHIWDREPEKGINFPVCCDIAIMGGEKDPNNQIRMLNFLYENASTIPFDSVLVFPNTGSLHINYDPAQTKIVGKRNATLRFEYLDGDGNATSKYFAIYNYKNIPWHLFHVLSSDITQVETYLKKR